MKKRSLICGLAVLFLAAGAAETWSQEGKVSSHRPATLMHLVQQRLCDALCNCDCDCDCTSKSQMQKGCKREVSDIVLDCERCGFSRPRPVANLLSRWNGAVPRLFPPLVSASPNKAGKGKGDVTTKDLPHSRKGCGCVPDLPADLSEPIPMIEKPQIDRNPFQDDALQPAPLPGAPTREARILPRPSINDPTDSTGHQPVVRHASYYLLSVEAD
jgi:hypothetical protein